MIETKLIDKIFNALDRQIGVHSGLPFSIAVCGGTALAALGLIRRTTKDVDILGEVIFKEKKIEIKKIDRLPQWFTAAAERVGRDFGLTKYWIDIGPAFQLEQGLPKGFAERLVPKKYGKYLTVYFISRIDQIYLKLFASLDCGGYHVEDFFKLNPSKEEILMAARWVLFQDDSPEFKTTLHDFLKNTGLNEIVKEL